MVVRQGIAAVIMGLRQGIEAVINGYRQITAWIVSKVNIIFAGDDWGDL
jgi:hypothetical protein